MKDNNERSPYILLYVLPGFALFVAGLCLLLIKLGIIVITP